MSQRDYVTGLSLARPMFTLPPASTARSQGGVAPEAAAVNLSTVVSFVGELTARERKDVLQSVQLAHRAATAQNDPFSETESWYGKFIEVLRAVGWVVKQAGFTKHHQQEGRVTINVQAVAALAGLVSTSGLALIQQALSSLEELAAGNGDAFRLLQQNGLEGGSGNVQIGVAERESGGAIGMAMGAFYFRSRDNRLLTLFGGWGKNEVDFWSSAHRMTLDSAMYADVRDTVRRKLGTPDDYIAGLDVSLPSGKNT